MFKRRKITGISLFCVGVLLIFCAAALCGFNIYSMEKAEAASAEIAVQLEEMVSDNRIAEGDASGSGTPAELAINGNRYIGIVSVPSRGLWLPVRADISYPALRESPCCYSGSVSGGDLVIAAHNYPAHFGTLSRLSNGEYIEFIDGSGYVTKYTVVRIEILEPDEVKRMTDSGYDLTLFTCTPGGGSRVTVRCMKI